MSDPKKCVCTPSGMEMSCLSCKKTIDDFLSNMSKVMVEFMERCDSVKLPDEKVCRLCTRFWFDECFESMILAIGAKPCKTTESVIVGLFLTVQGMAQVKDIPLSRTRETMERVLKSIVERGGRP